MQDRLKSVKLINKILNTCKQHLQCVISYSKIKCTCICIDIFQYQDLDLLRKELPNVQKDIGYKFHQKTILKKEFTDIVAENKRYLVKLILHIDRLNIYPFLFILESLSTAFRSE